MDSSNRRADFANEGYKALPFAVPFYPTISDLIVLLCTTILAGPAVVVWCTITSLSIVPLILTQMYFFISTKESEDVFDGAAFYTWLLMVSPFALCIWFVSLTWWGVVFAMSYILSLPVFAFYVMGGNSDMIKRNFQLLAGQTLPFFTGSCVQLARAILGQAHRQGCFSFVIGSPLLGSFASCFAYIPIMKFFWNEQSFSIRAGRSVHEPSKRCQLCHRLASNGDQALTSLQWHLRRYPNTWECR